MGGSGREKGVLGGGGRAWGQEGAQLFGRLVTGDLARDERVVIYSETTKPEMYGAVMEEDVEEEEFQSKELEAWIDKHPTYHGFRLRRRREVEDPGAGGRLIRRRGSHTCQAKTATAWGNDASSHRPGGSAGTQRALSGHSADNSSGLDARSRRTRRLPRCPPQVNGEMCTAEVQSECQEGEGRADDRCIGLLKWGKPQLILIYISTAQRRHCTATTDATTGLLILTLGPRSQSLPPLASGAFVIARRILREQPLTLSAPIRRAGL